MNFEHWGAFTGVACYRTSSAGLGGSIRTFLLEVGHHAVESAIRAAQGVDLDLISHGLAELILKFRMPQAARNGG
jgi:hypothetical protein